MLTIAWIRGPPGGDVLIPNGIHSSKGKTAEAISSGVPKRMKAEKLSLL